MRVSRWGNSLGVRLPRALVDELGLEPGDDVEIVPAAPTRLVVAKDDRRGRAVDRMRARAWSLPEGYSFDRDEANAR